MTKVYSQQTTLTNTTMSKSKDRVSHWVNVYAPKTVIHNNYLEGAQVINFSNEMKDNAQQTASNFIQNDNTPLPQLIYELRDTIKALPIEIQETINIDLDDITEDLAFAHF
jgi:hypothetical protein